jgi:cytidine deaminase
MKRSLQIEYQDFTNYRLLPDEDQLLVDQAYAVLEGAYAPYSKFKVGAVALLENGEIVKGSNQENIAYPSGLCAERVALFYAGANFPDVAVKTICIVAKGDLIPVDKLLSPCGSCRQVMLESEMRQNKPYRVIIVSQNDRTIVFFAAKDLVPFAFGLG